MAPKTEEKASDRAERMLIERMIDGTYPPGSGLPGERDLCKEFGVARPALREALQGLARDGWISIQQGKATIVNDFLRGGNLNVLIRLLRVDATLLPDFVLNLLELWCLVAPTYTRRAVENDPRTICQQLYGYRGLADRAQPYARAQWRLHRTLIDLSGNPVYGLILNSFTDFYARLARYYYTDPAARTELAAFWDDLHNDVLFGEFDRAAGRMQVYMEHTRDRWPRLDLSAWDDDALDKEEMDEEDAPGDE